jgi:putative redox protein
VRSERVIFESQAGHELHARLDMPVMGDPVAYAIFAHCFTCTKNLKAVGHITTALAEKGVATLRLDFTGLGESEGDFADTDFDTDVSDLVAAAQHLEETRQAPQILVGHSLGGTAALAATPSIESIVAVATIGAPSSPAHLLKVLDEDIDEIRREGRATVRLDGRPFTITESFLDSLDSSGLPHSLDELRTPLLITHSPLDNHVGIDNASELFMAARHPKSFLSLDNADHLLSREEDALYVGGVIAAWSARFLDTDTREVLQPDLSLEAPAIGTAVRTEEGLRTEVMANGFPLVADEPERAGGTNQGPTPYDLLTAALGTCTSMTLRMYSDRKGWPLESVTVYLEHNKVHASDCEGCEYEEGKIDHIRREITLEGDLDEEQRERLLQIADRCPVHRTLHGRIHVETSLVQ